MKKFRLLSIVTLGLGISIAAPAIAASAEDAAMDNQVKTLSQPPEAGTEMPKNTTQPATEPQSQEEKEELEWMNKTLEENAKANK